MELRLPQSVEQLRMFLLQYNFEGYFFGGCIRDYLLMYTPQDYDLIIKANLGRLHHYLETYGGYKVTTLPHSSHLFLTLNDGSEIQIMDKLKVEYDFTINCFQAPLNTLKVVGPRISFEDLANRVLRAIDRSPRVLRRGLYMLHKYPEFKPTRETVMLFQSVPVHKDVIEEFLLKKRFKRHDFMALCRKYKVKY